MMLLKSPDILCVVIYNTSIIKIYKKIFLYFYFLLYILLPFYTYHLSSCFEIFVYLNIMQLRLLDYGFIFTIRMNAACRRI